MRRHPTILLSLLLATVSTPSLGFGLKDLGRGRNNNKKKTTVPSTTLASGASRSFRYEAEDCLAQSLLIFLWADLRRLSTQGKVHTPFEWLTVASDDAVRNTADRWSATPDAFPELCGSQNPGLSPVHIMATLLVEMRRAVLDHQEDTLVLEALTEGPKGNGDVSLLNDLDTNLQAYSSQLLRDLRGTPDLDETELFSSMTRKQETPAFSSSAAASLQDGVARRNENLAKFTKLGDQIFALGTREAPTRSGGTSSMTEEELLDYIQDAITGREDGKLDFMSSLFKNDTTSQLAVQSEAKFVWMNDWHPTSDLLYAVSVDSTRKQVTVIFRGAQNEADFNICKDTELIEVPNPILEEYVNKTATIQIHAGFYKYLFRQRKDTGTCKYDEIVNIMVECAARIGAEYKVQVTGLSLGGALSTVFSLFASADERFRGRKGPLKCYTFGAPMMAGRTAADAFHRLEVTHKLQLARFYNVRDCITHFPPNPDGVYKHCGIKIKLHRPRPTIQWDVLPPVRKPEVAYEYLPSWAPDQEHKDLAFPDLIWFNLPLPWNIINVHLLPEHQRRALLARAVCQEEDPNEESTLDDLYQEFVHSKYDDN